MRALPYSGKLTLDTAYADPTPGADESLIRVRMAGVSSADLAIASGQGSFRGVLGHEMVGIVERGPVKWQGKRVVSEINCVCRACDMCLAGLSNHCRKRTVVGLKGRDGCFADFVSLPVRNLHAVPDALSDEEAVFAEPVASAFQVLTQCAIDRRMNVSVVGPGLLGLLVAQVMRTTGCTLTVLGRNTTELEFCEKKGIQGLHIDDFAPQNDRDVVVDCSASHEGLRLSLDLVRPRGTILLKGYGASPSSALIANPESSRRFDTGASHATDSNKQQVDQPYDLSPIVANEITLLGSRCGSFPQAIDALTRGAVDVRSMISRVFDLNDAIAAIQYAGRADVIKTLLRISG